MKASLFILFPLALQYSSARVIPDRGLLARTGYVNLETGVPQNGLGRLTTAVGNDMKNNPQMVNLGRVTAGFAVMMTAAVVTGKADHKKLYGNE